MRYKNYILGLFIIGVGFFTSAQIVSADGSFMAGGVYTNLQGTRVGLSGVQLRWEVTKDHTSTEWCYDDANMKPRRPAPRTTYTQQYTYPFTFIGYVFGRQACFGCIDQELKLSPSFPSSFQLPGGLSKSRGHWEPDIITQLPGGAGQAWIRAEGKNVLSGNLGNGTDYIADFEWVPDAQCGDGIVGNSPGEECDDANRNGEDQCTNSCKNNQCNPGSFCNENNGRVVEWVCNCVNPPGNDSSWADQGDGCWHRTTTQTCGSTAPSGVTASAMCSGTNPFNRISWPAVPGADRYRISRKSSPSSFITTNVGSTASLSIDDNSVSSGQTYYYTVSARKGGVYGNDSSQVSVTTSNCGGTPPPPPPPPPSGEQATVQGVKVREPDGSNDVAEIKNLLVTVDGKGTDSDNPYAIEELLTGHNYTVRVASPGPGWEIGYTLCYNDIYCHANTPTPGDSVVINIPENTSSSYNYADLWWHFTPPANHPKGYHDGVTCEWVSGWACDPDDYDAPLQVHFYKDGPLGSGSFAGSVTADRPREAGVAGACGGNANHGFAWSTPESLKDNATHPIYAYAINVDSGSNRLLNASPRTLGPCEPTSSNQAPIAVAKISKDGVTYEDSITVTRGVPTPILLTAAGSSDPDGWTSADGVSGSGWCEWNTDLNQGAPTFEERIDGPSNVAACNVSAGTKTFNDPPGTYTYNVLKITDNQGAESSVATVSVNVIDSPGGFIIGRVQIDEDGDGTPDPDKFAQAPGNSCGGIEDIPGITLEIRGPNDTDKKLDQCDSYPFYSSGKVAVGEYSVRLVLTNPDWEIVDSSLVEGVNVEDGGTENVSFLITRNVGLPGDIEISHDPLDDHAGGNFHGGHIDSGTGAPECDICIDISESSGSNINIDGIAGFPADEQIRLVVDKVSIDNQAPYGIGDGDSLCTSGDFNPGNPCHKRFFYFLNGERMEWTHPVNPGASTEGVVVNPGEVVNFRMGMPVPQIDGRYLITLRATAVNDPTTTKATTLLLVVGSETPGFREI